DFESALAAADIVVVSLEIPVEVAVRALELAHAAGTRTLLNPAPAAPMPDSVWPAVGVLTPNATEAAVLLGLDPDAGAHSAESLALRLHERTGATIMMTRGGHGVLVCLDGEITHVPPVEAAAVVDTTGAGDSFTGAAAVALAEGADPMTAAQFGARAGAWTVAHAEVIPALPHRSDLDSSSISSSPTT
ncbi:MAG: bifunctional hydroxymethylpyrimidine kinase/phosphomethylpyrimidine kinase, partial [Tetrasphaera sp.]|nr:bifunctional hydroxymethylpyrimidine kinase/phosphomethylpyrimidine kinase [Tetrasphaera sp.]